MSFVAPILREELADLAPYRPVDVPGIEVRLDANEAPRCEAPEIAAAVRRAVERVALERYPDPRATELRELLGARYRCDPDALIVGTGSDEVIALVATAFARPRAKEGGGTLPKPVLVVPTPTFVMYRVTGRAHGFKVVDVPLDDAWFVSLRSLRAAIDMMRPNVVFVATPNNPTGVREPHATLAAIAEACASIEALFVIDEAYGEYASDSAASLRREHENVAVLRTLSKIGLAALRIGSIEAAPDVVLALDKVRQPFNLSSVAQAVTCAVLREASDALEDHVNLVRGERARVYQELTRMSGVRPTPSEANFHWIRTERPADDVFRELAEAGILVRSFHERGGRLAQQLRVTVGTKAENDRFLEAMKRCAG